jgi:hypothetical protein
MIQNVVIVALVGLLLVAVSMTFAISRYRSMRLPHVGTMVVFVLGDLLFTASVASLISKFLLA